MIGELPARRTLGTAPGGNKKQSAGALSVGGLDVIGSPIGLQTGDQPLGIERADVERSDQQARAFRGLKADFEHERRCVGMRSTDRRDGRYVRAVGDGVAEPGGDLIPLLDRASYRVLDRSAGCKQGDHAIAVAIVDPTDIGFQPRAHRGLGWVGVRFRRAAVRLSVVA